MHGYKWPINCTRTRIRRAQEAVKLEEERLRAVAREAASLVARAEAEAARIASAMRIEGRRVVMESETTLISMAAERARPVQLQVEREKPPERQLTEAELAKKAESFVRDACA